MLKLFQQIWKSRGIWLRFLFCWALGLTFQFFDEAKAYDLRFQMRATQEVSKDIVLVNFDQADLVGWQGTDPNLLRSLKEVSVSTDSAFWNPATWNYLLSIILQQNPRKIGVNFFFSDQLKKPTQAQHSLADPRVIWAAQLDSEGRPALPLLATAYGFNTALVDLREDEDRILRRFYLPAAAVPHMGLKLAETLGNSPESGAFAGENRLINFRGRADIYPSISALAILEGRVPPSFFKDKIILIGSHSFAPEVYQTPLGPMSRNEILAQIVDDSLNQRWIERPSGIWVATYLLVILLLAVLILTTYPQAVALVFLLWLGAGSTSLSLWVFDSFYFWLPGFSPLALTLVTYMIFLGYQLSISENQTWRLEQEKALLSELEQLRNNFVSLISHDLKTPIAKIQAICDRLLAGTVAPDVKEGLSNVRQESSELHRYIQSILQLSRLESSQVHVRKEATDLNEIVETVIKQLAPITREKHQRVEPTLEPLFSIEADTVLIQEVILNLIENASKYTPDGGLIKVQTAEVDDRVIFSVEDNGPGIPEQDQEHLFEKFFRGQAGKSQIKGTGLGLFLVKYFIELHGGEVFLESEIGKGTKVRFTLPLQA